MSDISSNKIRLLLLDVDGVLTDGQLHISDSGELFKSFDAKDGVAVALLRKHGIETGIISGKSSKALDARTRQLGISIAVTGCHDKLTAYSEIKQQLQLIDTQIAYIGDDVIDLPVMRLVGQSYAPADAHALVRQAASHVTATCGGRGVAREAAEHILTEMGLTLEQAYQPLLDEWTTTQVQQ